MSRDDSVGDVCGRIAAIAALVNERPGHASLHEIQAKLRAELAALMATIDDVALAAHIATLIRAIDSFLASPRPRPTISPERVELEAATAALDRFARDACRISTLRNRPATAETVDASAAAGATRSRRTSRNDSRPPTTASLRLSRAEWRELLDVQTRLSRYADSLRSQAGFVAFGMSAPFSHQGVVIVELGPDGDALRASLRPDVEVRVASRDARQRIADIAAIESIAAKILGPGPGRAAASHQPFDDAYTLYLFTGPLPEHLHEQLAPALAELAPDVPTVHVEYSTARTC